MLLQNESSFELTYYHSWDLPLQKQEKFDLYYYVGEFAQKLIYGGFIHDI